LHPMMPSKPAATAHPWGDATTPYEEIGGEEAARALVEMFYDVIEEGSPVLRAMLPVSTSNTRRKFFMYLSGWLGGPALYEEKWGHPRLRMRHLPFSIGEAEAVEWMRCMRLAMDRADIAEPLRSFLDERFAQLALHMRNRADS
jgi:hemoglobin